MTQTRLDAIRAKANDKRSREIDEGLFVVADVDALLAVADAVAYWCQEDGECPLCRAFVDSGDSHNDTCPLKPLLEATE